MNKSKRMWVSIPQTCFDYTPRARVAWVTWRPRLQHLHYPELYASIYEFLRVPPVSGRRDSAWEYLESLLNSTNPTSHTAFHMLQRDRIEWVRAWLSALEEAYEEPLGKLSGRMN